MNTSYFSKKTFTAIIIVALLALFVGCDEQTAKTTTTQDTPVVQVKIEKPVEKTPEPAQKTPNILDPIQPVAFTNVHLNDQFWAPRIETNRAVTVPFAFKKCEETGRVDNFERAAKKLKGETLKDNEVKGTSFDDTDIYKVIEGASFGLAVKPDPKMEKYLDELIAKIAAAQEPDGYIYTARTINPQQPHAWSGAERWVNVKQLSHELYDCGHLYEAAFAHYSATGKKNFLNIATKSADLLCEVFGPGKNEDAPGHQIVEMGLCKLYRATGKQKYLDLAKFFLDTRGPGDGEYSQAHKKVIDQDEAVGHAVRATYMYSGMADVATLTGDQSYIKAIDKIWENAVSKKLYITGGIGSTGQGEAFGPNYDLPNETAYCETCAAIGNVYWNYRLFLLHGESKYIDVLERTLYNGLISGVSLQGKNFFYPNPLASTGQHFRSEWFGCACCPGNISRFIASVPGYMYAVKDNTIFINLYAAGNADISVNGKNVRLSQQTNYPWDGNVKITVTPQTTEKLKLKIRIPGWAQNKPLPSDLYTYMNKTKQTPVVKLNSQTIPLDTTNGYILLDRKFTPGDTIELSLPMPIRTVLANKNVTADIGRVAIERGPIVYCAEWPDNNGHTHNLLIDDSKKMTAEKTQDDILGSFVAIKGKATAYKEADSSTLPMIKTPQPLALIPYYAWAHRGTGEMDVWLAANEQAVEPIARPTIASKARINLSKGTGLRTCIVDGYDPKHSDDREHTIYHWWPNKGTLEWIEFQLADTETINSVAAYWLDDSNSGECKFPKSWKLLYKDADQWKPVQNSSGFGVEINKYNKVTFDSVKTNALRIEIQLQETWSAGIIEFKINPGS